MKALVLCALLSVSLSACSSVTEAQSETPEKTVSDYNYLSFNTYWPGFELAAIQNRYPDSLSFAQMMNFMLRGQVNRGHIESPESIDWSLMRVGNESLKTTFMKQRNLALKQAWQVIGKKDVSDELRAAAISIKDVLAKNSPSPSFVLVNGQAQLSEIDNEALMAQLGGSGKLTLTLPKRTERDDIVTLSDAVNVVSDTSSQWFVTQSGDIIKQTTAASGSIETQCMPHQLDNPVPTEAHFTECDVDPKKLAVKSSFHPIVLSELTDKKALVDLNLVIANVLKYAIPAVKSTEE